MAGLWVAAGQGRAGRVVGTGVKNKCAFLGRVRGQVRVPWGARWWWDGDAGRRGGSDGVSRPPSLTPVWPDSVLSVSVDLKSPSAQLPRFPVEKRHHPYLLGKNRSADV